MKMKINSLKTAIQGRDTPEAVRNRKVYRAKR